MKRPPSLKNSLRYSVLLSAVMVALGLSACGEGKAPDSAASAETAASLELAKVDVVQVKKATLSGGLPVSGTLQPVSLTTVQSRVAAEVNEVLVREGMRVQKGQLLAHLGTLDLNARLKQAQASLAAAKVEATLARALVDRNRQLYEKNYFSEIDFQKSVGEAEAREENVRAQQALVDIARKAEGDASVRSPINGIVAKRYVEPGSSIAVDGRLFDIVDLTQMELSVPVPATEIALVKVGQAVAFTVSGFGDRKFEGKVVRINPVADAGTRAISVYVRVENGGLDLKGGMFARGEISVGASGEALTVPLEALHAGTADEPSWVLVLRDGKLEKRSLETGSRDERNNRIVVSSGLEDGDIVVVARLTEKAVGQSARLSE